MANINISETDFSVLAEAAFAAYDKGDHEAANALDKLARKVNASLSNAQMRNHRLAGMPSTDGMSWERVPSVLAVFIKERRRN